LLLDRKRINRWAKWVALGLAVVFAGGFLFMGVGYGGAGFNVSEAFSSCAGKDTTSNPQTPEEKIKVFEEQLAQNPNDVTALLAIATVYQQEGGSANLLKAASYLERVLQVDPTRKEVYLRLANLYLSSEVADYSKAVQVLNKATTVDPENPDVFLKLGIAQRNLGNTSEALLAWQRYLSLAPEGDMADVIREQVELLSQSATTTTTGATTTTASTTATSSTTTTSAPTTTSSAVVTTTTSP
jgi:cytochrome c-type biogenesis protein CcmH/NrfG